MREKVIRIRRLMLEMRARSPRQEYAYNPPNMVAVERVREVMRSMRREVER